MTYKVSNALKLQMRLLQPSATQLVYQSSSWFTVGFLLFPLLGIQLDIEAIYYLSIIKSNIGDIDAWQSFLLRIFLGVSSFVIIYKAIRKVLIISTTTIFDKDLYKVTKKTKAVLGGEVVEYSFDLVADILVDGNRDGFSCIAIRLTNEDIINLDGGWYSSGGFDKKEKIVEQIKAFLNLSRKLEKRGK